MQRIIVIVLFLSFHFLSFTQGNYTLKGRIKNFPFPKIYLQEYYGNNKIKIDSCDVKNGDFEFKFLPKTHAGLYLLNNGEWSLEMIFNKENIEFMTDYNNLIDSLKILTSYENRLFYGYFEYNNLYDKKKEQLNKLLAFYSESDPFYSKIKTEFEDLKKNLDQFTNDVYNKNPNSFFGKIIKAQIKIKVDENLSKSERLDYLRNHYLDNVEFTYSKFVYSDLLTKKMWNYLGLFENKAYNVKTQNDNYIVAVDKILTKALANDTVFNFLVQDLSAFFGFGEHDTVYTFLNEKYVLPYLCEDINKAADVKNNIERNKRTAVGKKAPDIEIPINVNQNIHLFEINTDFTLVLFWSTKCPHCVETLPKLKELYEQRKNKKFEIIAVSIDAVQKDWADFISIGGYNWLNYWDGAAKPVRVSHEYFVRGTPMFYLLDKNKTIIAKPIYFENLVVKLKELKVF